MEISMDASTIHKPVAESNGSGAPQRLTRPEEACKRTDEKCERTGDDSADTHRNLFDPWAQFVVPAFPLDILPDALRSFVETQSVVMGCDASALAMAVLAALSGAIDHQFRLKMMRHGSWCASPRLWVLLAGDPSKKKTPIINAATNPLEQYQNRVQAGYRAELANLAEDESKPDPPPRIIIYDTTIEKLGELLSRSDRGLLAKRDEIAGWIGSMEKYGGSSRGAGADRAFWLQAYDGGTYIVDRIGRGEVIIGNLSVSLIGGIQPAKLAELHGLTSDGLLQRFIPVIVGSAKLPLDMPSDDTAYRGLVHKLCATQPLPPLLTLSDAALATMHELLAHLYELEQATGGLADGFQAFVGKLPGVAGSLALILHLASDPSAGARRQVEQATVEGVKRLVNEFILPHAFEFYRSAESTTNGDRLKKLASWILTSGERRFVASDLTSNVADFRGLTLFEVQQRVSPLEAAGWIEPNEAGPTNRSWHVNPAVFEQFADRASQEEVRKAELARLMGAPRRQQ
jgi:hypothetical protein